MGGGCGRVCGVNEVVCWGMAEVKRDVGGDEERFGVWGPNTLPYISPHILTFPLHLPSPYLPPHLNTLSYAYPHTFSKCGEVTISRSFWQLTMNTIYNMSMAISILPALKI